MINERLKLNMELDSAVFRNFYYLKQELIDFCRENRLPTSGSKTELVDRIAHFLDTGNVLKSSANRRKRMFHYVWPMVLIVISNTLYQICAKSVPDKMNPFASLILTYATATAFSSIMYFVLNRNGNLLHEYMKTNYVPFLFGIVLVALEVGWVYAYKAGWPVSTASIVQSAFLTVALFFVGWLLYREALTKVIGTVICLVGLAFINHK